ncbi:hypothetical protein L345_04272, partial [Ophiophagus hannah]
MLARGWVQPILITSYISPLTLGFPPPPGSQPSAPRGCSSNPSAGIAHGGAAIRDLQKEGIPGGELRSGPPRRAPPRLHSCMGHSLPLPSGWQCLWRALSLDALRTSDAPGFAPLGASFQDGGCTASSARLGLCSRVVSERVSDIASVLAPAGCHACPGARMKDAAAASVRAMEEPTPECSCSASRSDSDGAAKN